MKYWLIRAVFDILSLSGISRLVRRLSPCRGVIFTLHRVLPEPPGAFAPNAILQVTPDFLNQVIKRTRALGFDIVDLDEAVTRVSALEPRGRFAVFTFDDAYRDNLLHALPVLRAQHCPFTLFVPTAFVDGVGEVWWQALEDVIAANDTISLPPPLPPATLKTRTRRQKQAVYARFYAEMRAMPEDERVQFIRGLCTAHGVDIEAHCRSLIMDWDELKSFTEDPLCTIAAHTVHHYELAKLTAEQARSEMDQSATVLQMQLDRRPHHISYPIGSRIAAGPREYDMAIELGFLTGVTTIPGGLYHRHAEKLHALPRISLNGRFQKPRYLDVFLTGALFSLAGRD